MPYKTGTWGTQAKERNNRRFNKSLGKRGEVEAMQLLSINQKLPKGSKSDLFWNNKFVEVKTAIFSETQKRWKFFINRQLNKKVDYFLILCKIGDLTNKYVFLIPREKILGTTLNISINNFQEYEKYLFKKGG